jgi:hypothetical protein
MAAAPLPPGWRGLKTEAGRPYYWNTHTHRTCWERPSAIREADASEATGAPPAPEEQSTAQAERLEEDRGLPTAQAERLEEDRGLPTAQAERLEEDRGGLQIRKRILRSAEKTEAEEEEEEKEEEEEWDNSSADAIWHGLLDRANECMDDLLIISQQMRDRTDLKMEDC